MMRIRHLLSLYVEPVAAIVATVCAGYSVVVADASLWGTLFGAIAVVGMVAASRHIRRAAQGRCPHCRVQPWWFNHFYQRPAMGVRVASAWHALTGISAARGRLLWATCFFALYMVGWTVGVVLFDEPASVATRGLYVIQGVLWATLSATAVTRVLHLRMLPLCWRCVVRAHDDFSQGGPHSV